MEKYFAYDTEHFRKNIRKRFVLVGALYTVFLVWNFLQIPDSDRKEFLAIFLPMSALLGLFLYRSFSRQVQLLADTAVVLRDRKLLQYDRNIEIAEYDLTLLQKIYTDEYRSYPRVLLEWEANALSFVNLANSGDFVECLEKITGIQAESLPKSPGIISRRMVVYLTPSILYGIAVYLWDGGGIAYLNWATWSIFANLNLIIYILYGVSEREAKFESAIQSRRKILFVLMAIFIYQVLMVWNSTLRFF